MRAEKVRRLVAMTAYYSDSKALLHKSVKLDVIVIICGLETMFNVQCIKNTVRPGGCGRSYTDCGPFAPLFRNGKQNFRYPQVKMEAMKILCF